MTKFNKIDMSLDSIVRLKKPEDRLRHRPRHEGKFKVNKFVKCQKKSNFIQRNQKKVENRFNKFSNTKKVIPKVLTKKPIIISSKLFISNLGPQVTMQDLHELMQECGVLRSLSLLPKKNKFGFSSAEVEFRQTSSASKAIALYNGVPLDGRPMKVCVEKEVCGQFGNRKSSEKKKGQEKLGVSKESKKEKNKKAFSKPTLEQLNMELDAYIAQRSNKRSKIVF